MRAPAAILAVAALALGACGGSDPESDEDQVRGAIGDYASAVGGDEPERVCDLLVTPGGKRPPERCRERVGDGRLQAGQALGRVRVGTVRVRGGSAVAVLAGGEQVRLRRVDDGWRIVAPG